MWLVVVKMKQELDNAHNNGLMYKLKSSSKDSDDSTIRFQRTTEVCSSRWNNY